MQTYLVNFKWYKSEVYCANLVKSNDKETIDRYYSHHEIIGIKEASESDVEIANEKGMPVVNLLSYDERALLRAEKIGVCEYEVKNNLMIYLSYYGREGFYKVVHNLDNGKETRTHQKTTSKKYNYFVG